MADVQINRIQPEGESVLLLTQQVDALYDEISRRAFRLFESRGGMHGHDRADWLDAERSLIFAPPAELIEEDDEFGIRMAVPGFEPHQIRVSVLPKAIIVEGDSGTIPAAREQRVCFSELSDQKLLRRVNLPQAVRPFTAKAAIKSGILQITVRKAAQGSEPVEQSVAARA